MRTSKNENLRWLATTLAVMAVVAIVATSAGAENSLKGGAKSLQFEIERDFDLRSFDGSTISFKKHKSPGSAYRIGLSLSLHTSNSESFAYVTDSIVIDSLVYVSDNDVDRQSIGLTVQKLFYSNPGSPVNFFAGLGPTGGFSHTETKSVRRSSGSSQTRTSTSDATSWNAGLSFVAGVEWFAHKSISFLAEYDLRLKYTSSKNTRYQANSPSPSTERRTESNSSEFSLRSEDVRFGLSVYF